jgi:hypothetical protein
MAIQKIRAITNLVQRAHRTCVHARLLRREKRLQAFGLGRTMGNGVGLNAAVFIDVARQEMQPRG